MAKQQHLVMLRRGVNTWNQWRKENRGIVPVLSEGNLSGENLCKADLTWANFRDANLSAANLSQANLSRANLERADLSGANLSGANLSDAKLEYAKLQCAQMNKETLIQQKWRMVWEIMNDGIARKNLSGVDLSKANLSGANFSEADLSGANLSGANLSEANLRDANFSEADLSGANLSGANLRGANFSGVSFSGANIIGADIYEANFSKANITALIGASFNLKEYYEVYIDTPRTAVTSVGPVKDKIDFSAQLLSLVNQVSDKRHSLSQKNLIPGIILYTEQDELLHYIKNYFEYIDTLSGNYFHIYLLEKPPLKWKNSNLYWKDILEFYLHKLIPIFHWCRRIRKKPYNKSEVYEIARQWKIDINNLPCIIFFNPGNVSEKIIFNIYRNISRNNFEYYFRDLFSELERRVIVDDCQDQTNSKLESSVTFNKIKIEFMSIIEILDNKYLKQEVEQRLSKKTCVLRVRESNRTESNTAGSLSKTILILAANPSGTSTLRLDKEVREIDLGLQRAKERDLFDLKQRWAVRVQDVYQALLDYKPQIVHFSGHGAGEDGLILEDETGNLQLVNTPALANLFKLFSGIECIILNACYSEAQATAIVEYVPYVVGMNKGIGDNAAIKFATGFYNALGAGESVEFAYKLGCNVIQLEGIPEHMVPVLLRCREGVPSRYFIV